MLEAAIERATRALGSAADEAILELRAELRAMRAELEGLRRRQYVVPFRSPGGNGRA